MSYNDITSILPGASFFMPQSVNPIDR